LAVPRQPLITAATSLGISESEFLRRLIAGRIPTDAASLYAPSGAKLLLGSLAAFLLLVAVGKQANANH
jgi:hypothetical protein